MSLKSIFERKNIQVLYRYLETIASHIDQSADELGNETFELNELEMLFSGDYADLGIEFNPNQIYENPFHLRRILFALQTKHVKSLPSSVLSEHHLDEATKAKFITERVCEEGLLYSLTSTDLDSLGYSAQEASNILRSLESRVSPSPSPSFSLSLLELTKKLKLEAIFESILNHLKISEEDCEEFYSFLENNTMKLAFLEGKDPLDGYGFEQSEVYKNDLFALRRLSWALLEPNCKVYSPNILANSSLEPAVIELLNNTRVCEEGLVFDVTVDDLKKLGVSSVKTRLQTIRILKELEATAVAEMDDRNASPAAEAISPDVFCTDILDKAELDPAVIELLKNARVCEDGSVFDLTGADLKKLGVPPGRVLFETLGKLRKMKTAGGIKDMPLARVTGENSRDEVANLRPPIPPSGAEQVSSQKSAASLTGHTDVEDRGSTELGLEQKKSPAVALPKRSDDEQSYTDTPGANFVDRSYSPRDLSGPPLTRAYSLEPWDIKEPGIEKNAQIIHRYFKYQFELARARRDKEQCNESTHEVYAVKDIPMNAGDFNSILDTFEDQVKDWITPVRNTEIFKVRQDPSFPNFENWDSDTALKYKGFAYDTWREIQPMDLGRLLRRARGNAETAKNIVDKDVVVLVGGTGAGKSTTIHFLAGTKFEMRRQKYPVPGKFPVMTEVAPSLERFKTSAAAKSETKTIDSLEYTWRDSEDENREHILNLCDTPGFQDTAGPEIDIANGYSLVKVLQCCKSIKLVFLISQKDFGNRCINLATQSSTLNSLLTDFSEDLKNVLFICTSGFDEYLSPAEIKIIIKKARNEAVDNAPKHLNDFLCAITELDDEELLCLNRLGYKNSDELPADDYPLPDPNRFLHILEQSKRKLDCPAKQIRLFVAPSSETAVVNQCIIESKKIKNAVSTATDEDYTTAKQSLIQLKEVRDFFDNKSVSDALSDALGHIKKSMSSLYATLGDQFQAISSHHEFKYKDVTLKLIREKIQDNVWNILMTSDAFCAVDSSVNYEVLVSNIYLEYFKCANADIIAQCKSLQDEEGSDFGTDSDSVIDNDALHKENVLFERGQKIECLLFDLWKYDKMREIEFPDQCKMHEVVVQIAELKNVHESVQFFYESLLVAFKNSYTNGFRRDEFSRTEHDLKSFWKLETADLFCRQDDKTIPEALSVHLHNLLQDCETELALSFWLVMDLIDCELACDKILSIRGFLTYFEEQPQEESPPMYEEAVQAENTMIELGTTAQTEERLVGEISTHVLLGRSGSSNTIESSTELSDKAWWISNFRMMNADTLTTVNDKLNNKLRLLMNELHEKATSIDVLHQNFTSDESKFFARITWFLLKLRREDEKIANEFPDIRFALSAIKDKLDCLVQNITMEQTRLLTTPNVIDRYTFSSFAVSIHKVIEMKQDFDNFEIGLEDSIKFDDAAHKPLHDIFNKFNDIAEQLIKQDFTNIIEAKFLHSLENLRRFCDGLEIFASDEKYKLRFENIVCIIQRIDESVSNLVGEMIDSVPDYVKNSSSKVHLWSESLVLLRQSYEMVSFHGCKISQVANADSRFSPTSVCEKLRVFFIGDECAFSRLQYYELGRWRLDLDKTISKLIPVPTLAASSTSQKGCAEEEESGRLAAKEEFKTLVLHCAGKHATLKARSQDWSNLITTAGLPSLPEAEIYDPLKDYFQDFPSLIFDEYFNLEERTDMQDSNLNKLYMSFDELIGAHENRKDEIDSDALELMEINLGVVHQYLNLDPGKDKDFSQLKERVTKLLSKKEGSEITNIKKALEHKQYKVIKEIIENDASFSRSAEYVATKKDVLLKVRETFETIVLELKDHDKNDIKSKPKTKFWIELLAICEHLQDTKIEESGNITQVFDNEARQKLGEQLNSINDGFLKSFKSYFDSLQKFAALPAEQESFASDASAVDEIPPSGESSGEGYFQSGFNILRKGFSSVLNSANPEIDVQASNMEVEPSAPSIEDKRIEVEWRIFDFETEIHNLRIIMNSQSILAKEYHVDFNGISQELKNTFSLSLQTRKSAYESLLSMFSKEITYNYVRSWVETYSPRSAVESLNRVENFYANSKNETLQLWYKEMKVNLLNALDRKMQEQIDEINKKVKSALILLNSPNSKAGEGSSSVEGSNLGSFISDNSEILDYLVQHCESVLPGGFGTEMLRKAQASQSEINKFRKREEEIHRTEMQKEGENHVKIVLHNITRFKNEYIHVQKRDHSKWIKFMKSVQVFIHKRLAQMLQQKDTDFAALLYSLEDHHKCWSEYYFALFQAGNILKEYRFSRIGYYSQTKNEFEELYFGSIDEIHSLLDKVFFKLKSTIEVFESKTNNARFFQYIDSTEGSSVLATLTFTEAFWTKPLFLFDNTNSLEKHIQPHLSVVCRSINQHLVEQTKCYDDFKYQDGAQAKQAGGAHLKEGGGIPAKGTDVVMDWEAITKFIAREEAVQSAVAKLAKLEDLTKSDASSCFRKYYEGNLADSLSKIREQKLTELVLEIYKNKRDQTCKYFNNVPELKSNDLDGIKNFFAEFGKKFNDFLIMIDNLKETFPNVATMRGDVLKFIPSQLKILETDAVNILNLSAFPNVHPKEHDRVLQIVSILDCFSDAFAKPRDAFCNEALEYAKEIRDRYLKLCKDFQVAASNELKRQMEKTGITDKEKQDNIADYIIKCSALQRAQMASEGDSKIKSTLDTLVSEAINSPKSVKGGVSNIEKMADQLAAAGNRETNKLLENGTFSLKRLRIFQDKTSNVKISDVVGSLKESYDGKCPRTPNVAPKNKQTLSEFFAKFEDKFESSVKAITDLKKNKKAGADDTQFNNEMEGLINRAQIICRGKTLAQATSEDLIQVVSDVFAYWTLNENETKELLAQLEPGADLEIKNLKKPHAAQLIGIFRLLGLDTTGSVSNQLVEIKTGEGKSIVLATMCIVLALFGYEVHCGCYSDLLSDRDYFSFQDMFKAFKVDGLVTYGTFTKLSEIFLNEGGDIRELCKQFMTKGSALDKVKAPSGRKKVLLIDEVDVFFSKSFFGQQYRPVALLQSDNIKALLMRLCQIYESKKNQAPSWKEMTSWEEYQNVIDDYPSREELIVRLLKFTLLELAVFEDHEYHFNTYTRRVEYADDSQNHGFSDKIVWGAKTMFAYFKEFADQRLDMGSLQQHIGLNLICGEFSYAELPKKDFGLGYDFLMGVSGTLSTLSDPEIDILRDYKIQKFTYLPSMYNNSATGKVVFSANVKGVERDFAVIPRMNWKTEVIDEIIKRRKSSSGDRAVLVFFESMKELKDFYENNSFYDGEEPGCFLKEVMSENDATEDRNVKMKAIHDATSEGKITLITKAFGRGTDFISNDKAMDERGGVHVIQTFFSTEYSEQVQIQGRTGRQGEKGSYSLIIEKESLDIFGLGDNDVDDILSNENSYDKIDAHRRDYFRKIYEMTKNNVQFASGGHKKSLELVKHLLGSSEDAYVNLLNFQPDHPEYVPQITRPKRTIILIDGTGSMWNVLEATKDCVAEMFQAMYATVKQQMDDDANFHVMIAMYRNYNCTDAMLLQKSDWSASPEPLVDWLRTVEVNGGMGAEAIEMGLWCAMENHSEDEDGQKIDQIILVGDRESNSRTDTNTNRARCTQNRTQYREPVYFEDQLNRVVAANIPIYAFAVGDVALPHFQSYARSTGGEAALLDVENKNGESGIYQMVTKRLLSDYAGGDKALEQKLLGAFKELNSKKGYSN